MRDITVIREALHVLYAYTSHDANPPGAGRSETHAKGRAALARLEEQLAVMEAARDDLSKEMVRYDAAQIGQADLATAVHVFLVRSFGASGGEDG